MRILDYDELKTPGNGYVEFINLEFPQYYRKPYKCTWLDEKALMVDLQKTYSDRYTIFEYGQDNYNKFSKHETMAWRVWDAEPTENDMCSNGWPVEKRK